MLPAVAIAGLIGCSNADPSREQGKDATDQGPVVVYVTNYPLQYFAQRIGGEQVEVHFPAPANVDPAYWIPDSSAISQYQQADLILLNGAGYEKWVDAVSLPTSKLCDTSDAFTAEFIVLEGAVTHSHGPAGKHAHGGIAFTTWLDPTLAVQQADAVRAAFAQLRPERAGAFQQAYDALRSDLEELHRELAALTSAQPERRIVFSHPVYQYLARRYEFSATSVHWEPDVPPTDAMWAELKSTVEARPAQWMVWENEPLDATRDRLAELGIVSVVYDPCANVPADGDFLATQRKNLAAMAKIYAASQ